MKLSKPALASLVLWAATVTAFGVFFVRGNTAPGTDHRTAILLAPAERDLILHEMRGFLSGVHNILDGLNKNDMKQVAGAARGIGMQSAVDVNPALMAKLPLPFKQLGMSVHRDMDALADAAASGAPAPALQSRLTATLGKCVACHAGWQLTPTH